MTRDQADILMAAIAQVAEEYGPFRDGWPGVAESEEEALELKGAAHEFNRTLAEAIRTIAAQHPDVVARWRRVV